MLVDPTLGQHLVFAGYVAEQGPKPFKYSLTQEHKKLVEFATTTWVLYRTHSLWLRTNKKQKELFTTPTDHKYIYVFVNFILMDCIFRYTRYMYLPLYAIQHFKKDLKMFCLTLNKWLIFTDLKLWVAVARHNFKRVKI